ncbi:MAG: hypothetical protein Q9162_001933 [Coniocarpon cinnabarinum]
MNSTGDVTVRKLHEVLHDAKQRLGIERQLVILRGYKPTAEVEVLQQPSKTASHKENSESRKKKKDTQVDDGLLSSVELYIKRQHITSTKNKHPFISNSTVVEKELSVGWMMGRFLGLVDVNDPLKQPDKKYPGLRAQLVDFHLGEKMLEEEMSFFNRDLQILLADVLDKTDVLICTTTQALDPHYHANFDADIMIIDEASQVNDIEFGGLMASYRQVQKILFAGDLKQHGVFTKYDVRKNPFYWQWIKSVHERFHDCGHVAIHFYEQKRCTPDIASLVSEVYYDGKIRSDKDRREEPAAKEVRSFNQNQFSLDSNVVFVNAPDSSCEKLESGSRWNRGTADVVLKLVQKLQRSFDAADIMTLAPYRAQTTIHRQGLQLLAEGNDEFSKVRTFTLKGVQGQEIRICVLDLTVEQRVFFLHETCQTLVGCSRGSDALYIIGNVTKLRFMPDFRSEAVGRLVKYCSEKGVIVQWHDDAGLDPNRFKSKMWPWIDDEDE